jgi:hypothetical protein
MSEVAEERAHRFVEEWTNWSNERTIDERLNCENWSQLLC